MLGQLEQEVAAMSHPEEWADLPLASRDREVNEDGQQEQEVAATFHLEEWADPPLASRNHGADAKGKALQIDQRDRQWCP